LIPSFDNSCFFPGKNDLPPPVETPIDSEDEDAAEMTTGQDLFYAKK
jgi:hypothetical protein